jgi:5-methylcytosine-specific restriction endonuclease McrA
MICENCKENHNGSYGSGRFCSSSCARIFSSRKKTKETYIEISKKLKGISPSNKGTKLQKYIYEIKCIKCNNSFLKELAENYYKNNRYLKICNDCNKVTTKNKDELYKIRLECGRTSAKSRLENVSLLSWEKCPRSEKLRRVLKEQDNKCFRCKIDSWQEKSISLQLHHKDGNRSNFKRENLEYLCPNCHSQTDNFTSKNSTRYKLNQTTFVDEEFIKSFNVIKNIKQTLIQIGAPENSGSYDRVYRLLKDK